VTSNPLLSEISLYNYDTVRSQIVKFERFIAF